MSDLQAVFRHLTPELVESHHRFLGDRLLEGRGVGSRGGRIAEAYIESVYRGAGLGTAGQSYRQRVPMIEMIPDPALEFDLPDGNVAQSAYRDEFVLEAGVPESHVETDAELVFCGFGIEAPEFGWNDFEGMDVRGKVLLLRVNDPGRDDPEFFEGPALTYYGRWTYKFEEAARRGAAGAILIHTTASAGYGWNVVRSSNTGPQYSLAGQPEFPLQIRGWMTEGAAERLLRDAGHDLRALIAASDRRDFTPVATGIQVRATVDSQIREIETANVVGLLPGTDAARSAEPIIFMSHHDHLGMSTSDGETRIYPGAYDNASGVALILAIADSLHASGVRFPRPLLFLASTAEESGLLGSEWYTRHPTFPLARTAAVLNVDGANLYGATDDIAPLGVDRSSLGDQVRGAATAESMSVAPEQHPEQGMFFRQDHFPFARAGVPAIAFDHGLTYRDRPEGWGEEMYRDFVANHYHQPSDELRADFQYEGAVQQGRVMLRVAAAVAEDGALPDWLPTASFRRPG